MMLKITLLCLFDIKKKEDDDDEAMKLINREVRKHKWAIRCDEMKSVNSKKYLSRYTFSLSISCYV